MGAHDVFGDGEAEAGAARFAGAGFIDAIEAFEEARKVLGRNAGAEITDIKFDAAVGGAARRVRCGRPNGRTSWRCRSGWKTPGESLRGRRTPRAAIRRSHCRHGIEDLELHALAARNFTKTFFGIIQKFDGRNGLGVEAGLAGFDPGQSEQIFCEARHAGGVFADDFQKLAGGAGVLGNESSRVSEYP